MQTTNTLLAALTAEKWHAGQFRADGVTPYFNHVADVAERVEQMGGGEYAVIVAYLHDILEDTAMPPDEIAELFGNAILQTVKELTYPEGLPNRFDRMVAAIPNMSDTALLVKLADAKCNLADMENSGWDAERLDRQTSRKVLMIAKLTTELAVRAVLRNGNNN